MKHPCLQWLYGADCEYNSRCRRKHFLSPALHCIVSALLLIIALAGCATSAAERGRGLPLHHTSGGFRNYPPAEPEPLKGILFNARRVADYFMLPTAPREHYLDEEQALIGYYNLEQENTLTWLGHSTFLIKLGGRVILTDPFLSDIASPFFIGPRRYVPPGITISNLPRIDVIVISHNHADHLDAKTIERLPWKDSIEVMAPLGLKDFFTERGYVKVTELDWSQAAVTGDIRFESLPAVHSSGRKMFGRDRNETLWCSWAITFGALRIYFAGDTAYSHLFKDIGNRFGSFDVALVPIGAYLPKKLLSMSHAGPEEAVTLGSDVNANVLVPMHWGTIQLSDEPPFEPVKRFQEAAEKKGFSFSRVWLMRIGETRRLQYRTPGIMLSPWPLGSEQR